MTTNARGRHAALAAAGWSWTLLIAALVGTGALLAGCRAPATDAGAAPPATAPPSTVPPSGGTPVSAPPSGAAPVSGQPAGTATGDATTPACRRPEMEVTEGGTDAGSGHRSLTLIFTNVGTRACRVSGYPGVAGLDAGGTQVAQAQRTPKGYLGGLIAGSPPVLTLAPGASVAALVEALAFNVSDGSACKAFGGLLVTVPDDTVTTRLPWNSDGCSALEVHPIVLGTTGRSG
jgi:hypothetical protein